MKYDQNTLPTDGAWTADKGEEPEQEKADAPQFWCDLPEFKNLSENGAKSMLHGVMSVFMENELARLRLENKGFIVNMDASWPRIYEEFKEVFNNLGHDDLYDAVLKFEDLG